MPKGTLLKEVEIEAIRIGHAMKITPPGIAHYLSTEINRHNPTVTRSRKTVWEAIRKMQADGTIANLPMPFMVDLIGRDMMRVEALRQEGMRG